MSNTHLRSSLPIRRVAGPADIDGGQQLVEA